MFEHSHSAVRYPDYYLPRKIVLDAKYKVLQEKEIGSFKRDDLNQIVTYMHVLALDKGGFIFPGTKKIAAKSPGLLKGKGGIIYPICLVIPQDCKDYKTFCNVMAQSEEAIRKQVTTIIA